MTCEIADASSENFRKTKVHCQRVGDASEAAELGEMGGLPGPGSMVLASAGPPWLVTWTIVGGG